jgi:hypothetical protein
MRLAGGRESLACPQTPPRQCSSSVGAPRAYAVPMMTTRSHPMRIALTLAIAGAAVAACESGDTHSEETCDISIDVFKELLVVDEGVIGDDRSRNDANGPWSFRHAIESMKPANESASAFVMRWFDDWATRKSLNGFVIDREPRAQLMRVKMVCPWLKETPQNQCDTACEQCVGSELDMAKAPFRLLAIVYRPDLGPRPDTASPAGEARLVFALTDGPADDPASAPMPFGLILEYALPVHEMGPSQWAQAWHALGAHGAHDESYKQSLAELTEKFVGRDAAPGAVNGSAISQIRTNESAFNWIWQLREFRLDSFGRLALAPVANTPGEPLNDSPVLRDWVQANAEAIKADMHVLPSSLAAGSSNQMLFTWMVPDVDEATRAAFSRGTCSGCHSGEKPMIASLDVAFHVSPFRSGEAKLSPFILEQEVPLRTASMQGLLCRE